MTVSRAGFRISNVAKLLKLLDSETESPESCAELVSVLVQDLFRMKNYVFLLLRHSLIVLRPETGMLSSHSL